MNKLRYITFMIFVSFLLKSCVFLDKKSDKYKNVKISQQICDALKVNDSYNGFYIESNKGKMFYINPAQFDSICFKNEKDLSYEYIEDVEKITNSMGMPVINVTFDKVGAKLLSDITAKNIDKRIGVLVQGKLIIAPKIMSPINGGKVQINGNLKPLEIDNIYEYLAKIVKCKRTSFSD